MKVTISGNAAPLTLYRSGSLTRWRSYCPICNRAWDRRNERAGRRSYRRHMETMHSFDTDEVSS